MPGSGAAVIDKCNRQHRAEVQGVIVPRPFSLRIYLHDLPCVMVVIYFARLLRALFLGCIKGRRFCLAGMFLRRASERQGEEAAAGEDIRGDTQRVICHLYGASGGRLICEERAASWRADVRLVYLSVGCGPEGGRGRSEIAWLARKKFGRRVAGGGIPAACEARGRTSSLTLLAI